MSKVKKQIGDQVMITAGQFKNRIGKLVAKESHGWTVELDDGQQVSVSFPMVALVQNSETQTERHPSEEANAVESRESTQIEDDVVQVDSDTQTDDTTAPESEANTEYQDDSSGQNPTQDSAAQDITKMTVKQLQSLAKQRGIGIARTKPDFIRIIKEKNPDEDMDQLIGKTLFNRVSELHVSRLRTKEDLVKLLS